MLKKCWRKFRIWWNKKHPSNKIECISVWERVGERHVHLHVLARCGYVDRRVLVAFFQREIDSPMQWVKHLYSHAKRVAYATKYISKDLAKLPGTNRYSVTHGFDDKSKLFKPDPFYEGMTWEFSRDQVLDLAKRWLAQGFRVDLDVRRESCRAWPPWETQWAYRAAT